MEWRARPEAQVFREPKLVNAFQIGRITWWNLNPEL